MYLLLTFLNSLDADLKALHENITFDATDPSSVEMKHTSHLLS